LTKYHRLSFGDKEREVEKSILVPNVETAKRCVEFIKNQLPEEQREKEGSLRIVCLELKRHDEGLKGEDSEVLKEWSRVVAVCFEASVWPVAKSFWQHFGEGISSRRADFCRSLWDRGMLVKMDESELGGQTNGVLTNGHAKNGIETNGTVTNGISHVDTKEAGDSIKANGGSSEITAFNNLKLIESIEAKKEIRNRIAEMYFIDSVDLDSASDRKVTDEQLESVLLYPTGMSSLAAIHRSLLQVRGPLKSICFG
jgi:cystathionine gamma-synthase